MKQTKVKQKIDRRTAADFWSYAQITLVLLSWLLFIIALVMSYYAAPDKDYGVLRYYDIEIRQFWLTPLTGYLYILLWLSALGSYLALMTDKYRSRRRSDAPLGNLIFLLAVNLTWLVYILVKVQ
ncbi:hypothetical protein A9Q75_04430 [Colwellia psychrerythraea]|uniref:Uncharacterized protein n=1 Tax=Colwellia psychrerythraea TaxID=28229 RepID=A0A1Y5EN19_COLPS|nr:hypothetical protein A9Q75_04430 [Colwellia psychrerythraea]